MRGGLIHALLVLPSLSSGRVQLQLTVDFQVLSNINQTLALVVRLSVHS